MTVYRVNGITIDEETFRHKIITALSTYKCASLEQLSAVLKAKPVDIQNVLDTIIIAYIKANPGKSYVEVCTDLNVKSDFIEKLIDEGRLEVTNVSFDILKQIESERVKETSAAVRKMQNREAIMGLNSMASTPVPEKKIGPHFYTSPSSSRKR